MSRHRQGLLLIGLVLAADGGVARAVDEFVVLGVDSVVSGTCVDWDAPFAGLDDLPQVVVTDQGAHNVTVVCGDPMDPTRPDRVVTLSGFLEDLSATGWVAASWETWNQANPSDPADLRQVDVTSDAMIEQYDDRVDWRPFHGEPDGFGAREAWILEPFDVDGTDYDSPTTSRVLPGGKILAEMDYSLGKAILEVGSGGSTRSLLFATPQALPGGGMANFIGRWRANDDGMVLASLEEDLSISAGLYLLGTIFELFGLGTPVAGGPPVVSFDDLRFDLGEDVALFVDQSSPARLLTRILDASEDAQLEDTAQAYGSVDLWNPRSQLGLLPGDRLSVVSSDGSIISFRSRWSPFQTAIQAGDVLDGKTVQLVELGTRSTAADLAVVVVTFTDFSESYYLIARPPPTTPALPVWGVALLAPLLAGVAWLGRRTRYTAV